MDELTNETRKPTERKCFWLCEPIRKGATQRTCVVNKLAFTFDGKFKNVNIYRLFYKKSDSAHKKWDTLNKFV